MAVRTNTDTDTDTEQETSEQGSDTGKQLSPPYEESTTEIGRETLTPAIMEQHIVDINYLTFGDNEKAVRCSDATTPTPHNDVPAGCVEFQYNKTQYRYNTDENRLLSVGYRTQTVARPDQITSIEMIQYPDPAVVAGVVQDGVDATVYYRSPRSDRIQETTLSVQSVGEQGQTLIGTSSGERYIAQIGRERSIMVVTDRRKNPIGKVARVEFPKGHQYTVSVAGLKDSETTDRTKQEIQHAIQSALSEKQVDITVDHNGRIEG